MKILVINLGGLGDMLFSVPFLRGLRDRHKTAEITLLTVTNSYGIIENQKLFDKVVELSAGSSDIRRMFVFKYLRLLSGLRKEKYDLSINLRTVVSFTSAIKTALMLFAVGARKNTGRGNSGTTFIYETAVVEKQEYKKHEVDYHAELAEKLGFKPGGKIGIKLEKANYKFASNFLAKNRISPKAKFIVINQEARWETKRWLPANYLSLIEKLIKIKNIKIILLRNKDTAFVQVVKKIFKKVVILKNNDIKNIAAVIKRASVLLTNDTGIIHVGAALNTKTVGLYGSSDPFLAGPYISLNRKIVICKSVHCAPCNKLECSSLDCFEKITVEEVHSAIIKLLGVE
ncbi:MAG: hypothetical protein A2452_03315 [Candidatus Firestonebacteria bacterium RIFOXYC2_FULL_39_67]|nr:MAG: hypothetical protein A2536_02730 [Candidatus Firestonebacteria bacterium RIFOXYD2_FULL_39_29]OGF55297.1 MAG: hypothetical protein A2452_03315 [Candidatus Firestonebacteria bacterium RIFOXYC2_FULL_39_67]